MVEDLNRKRLMFFLTIALMCMMVTRVGAQQATVSVVPTSSTVPNVGSTFSVNVAIENVKNLYAWGLRLYYPNNLLNGTNATKGSFLDAGGIGSALLVGNFTDGYNATYGLLSVLCTRTGDVPGVNGSGTLLTINFRSISTGGPAVLHLDNVELSDSNMTAISSTTVDGEVTVIPEYSALLILPLLIASSLVALTFRKKIFNNRGIFQRL
jgi:hypothetical protein